jgi:hypothetical protein
MNANKGTYTVQIAAFIFMDKLSQAKGGVKEHQIG